MPRLCNTPPAPRPHGCPSHLLRSLGLARTVCQQGLAHRGFSVACAALLLLGGRLLQLQQAFAGRRVRPLLVQHQLQRARRRHGWRVAQDRLQADGSVQRERERAPADAGKLIHPPSPGWRPSAQRAAPRLRKRMPPRAPSALGPTITGSLVDQDACPAVTGPASATPSPAALCCRKLSRRPCGTARARNSRLSQGGGSQLVGGKGNAVLGSCINNNTQRNAKGGT